MFLHERLKGLIGHKVLLSTEYGDQLTDEGILEEVGVDYIVIKPDDYPDDPLDSKEDYSRMGAHWIVNMDEAMPIATPQSCIECLTKPVA